MTSPAPRHRPDPDLECGSITLFVVIIAIALFAFVGLVIDGSGKVRALRAADHDAGEAARAGAQQVAAAATTRAGRGAGIDIDTGEAARAARAYLRAAGITGTVTVTGTTLHITTTDTYRPRWLGAIGVGPQTVTGSADARLTRVLDSEV